VAQTGEYKDILESRPTLTKEAYFKKLLEFQNENPEWPNVYFQMGNIQLAQFLEFDPLVDRNSSRQFIYNAKTNFGLAKNYMDEKEARKNYEWYGLTKVKDKDSLVDMTLQLVDDRYTQTVAYSENYEKLVFHFDKAVSFYLSARENFIDINTRAENLRELFLTADDVLKEEIKTVGRDFDSSLYHLERYKQVYQKMPYKKIREANIMLKEIDHYRMNGITPSNFLSDNLELWDYRSWSQNFIKLIEEEVDALKDELSNAYESFNDINTRMMESEECIQANIDDMKLQRLINLVTKYDNQSLLIDIYKYLMSKLAYGNELAYELNCNVSDIQPTDNLLSRKARIYLSIYRKTIERKQ
jgi:hypothetical protein